MSFPAFAANQGLLLAPNVAPNGGSSPSYVNRYSMGFDLYLTGENWFSFFQTNATNVNDGEFFRRATAEGGGIGIGGVYDGSLPSNQWHRVVLTFDMPEGGTPTLKKYIDGSLVGTQTLGDGYEGRWALYANSGPDPQNVAYLLADESGDTTPGLIASYYFTDSVLTEAQVLALGGPTAGGFVPVPEPTGAVVAGFAAVGLMRLARRRCQRGLSTPLDRHQRSADGQGRGDIRVVVEDTVGCLKMDAVSFVGIQPGVSEQQ